MNHHRIRGQRKAEFYQSIADELKELPNKTAGRILHERRPDLFHSVEVGRDFMRLLKGAKKGHVYKSNTYAGITVTYMKSTINEGLAKLRAYEAKKPEPIVLTGCEILVLSDIHIPFHDLDALTTALEYGAARNPDVILLNGDILDCYDISRFMKEQDRPSIVDEIGMGIEFLTLLREQFPKARIIYKLGNHEERMRNYILKNAPEFGNLEALEFHSLLRFEKLGIERVDRQIIKAGKLNILHGHEMGEAIFSPVNPARGFFLKAKANTLVGHYHQSSHHSEGDLNGNKVGVWSTGCLCSLSPEYRPYAFTKWKHGFAYVTVDNDGTFIVENKEVIDGRIF
jgi:predicted phosphodiesterase